VTRRVKVRTGVPDFAVGPGAVSAPVVPGAPVVPPPDTWVPVGPAVTLRGDAHGRPRVSGRFTALAVHPSGQRVYAGSALGGLWYSDDGGGRWMALDFCSSTRNAAGVRLFADAMVVGAIAVEWGATAAADVVYVGAGEYPAPSFDPSGNLVRGIGIRRAEGPVAKTLGADPPVAADPVGPAADPWRVEAPELSGVVVNRLVREDAAGAGDAWAATSLGLYRRSVAAGVASWNLVNTGFGAVEFTDVAIGHAVGSWRFYAATADGRVARSIDGAAWMLVNLPAVEGPIGRAIAFPPVNRVRLAIGNIGGGNVTYALADGPRLWRIDDAAANVVTGLPSELFTTHPVDDSQPAGIALAVHPAADAAHQDLIAIGGQAATFPTAQVQASLYKGKVTLNGAGYEFSHGAPVKGLPPEWIGDGIPVGIRSLEWVPGPGGAGPAHLWAAGDSGVFRSETNGDRGTFQARNTGLAVVESTSLAQAAGSDAVMLLATRGAGVLRRVSCETWEVSLPRARGGVAIDPQDASRMYAQIGLGIWSKSTDGGLTWSKLAFFTPATGRKGWTDAQNFESAASASTSRLALLSQSGSDRGTQVALGTDRVWYTDDALLAAPGKLGSGWVTLPSGGDPYGGAAPDRKQDQLAGKVLQPCWGSADRLYVLTEKGVHSFERGADAKWTLGPSLYDQDAVEKKTKVKAPVGQIPADLTLVSLAVHDANRGKGRLYVGTAGAADKDHVWWFDGIDAWVSAGMKLDSPVHALVVDPRDPNILYAGTDEGVWKGTGTFPAAGAAGVPNWVWTRYSTGLPEAACVELLISTPEGGAQQLLRAALAGRGVWEVVIDGHLQAPEVFLRAHPFETRRPGVPEGGPRSPFVDPAIRKKSSSAREQVRLDASPDIRIWRAPTALAPSPSKLPVVAPLVPRQVRPVRAADTDAFDVWLLQSALRAKGEDLDPEGEWLAASDTALENQRQKLPLVDRLTDYLVWTSIVDGNQLAYDNNPPDHADLARYLRDEPDRWPKGTKASCACADLAKVMVTVRSRHWRSIARNAVRVLMLKAQFGVSPAADTPMLPGRTSLANVPLLPAGWAAEITAVAGPHPGPILGDRRTGRTQLNNVTVDQLDSDVRAKGWRIGMFITGAGIPVNTTIVSIDDRTGLSLVMSAKATAAAQLVDLTAGSWLFADPAVPFQAVGGILDPHNPQTVTFEMNLSGGGWDKPGWLLLAVVLVDGDPLSTVETDVAKLVQIDHRVAPRSVRSARRFPITTDYYAGMDAMYYHSIAKAMDSVWANSNLICTGLYFDSPAMAPGEPPRVGLNGHNANGTHTNPTWMVAWNALRPHWGIMPLYWGQQDSLNEVGPKQLTLPGVAAANAEDAAAKAATANVPKGAVIYLDYEKPGPGPDALTYCRDFFHYLAARGYRPGVYCHPDASVKFRQDCPGLFVWNVSALNGVYLSPGKDSTIISGQFVLDTPPLNSPGGDPMAIVRQWRETVLAPPVIVGGVYPVPGFPNPDIDANVAIVADPAFPERRCRPRLVHGGKVTVTPSLTAPCSIYAVRAGRPVLATWPLAAPGAPTQLTKGDLPFWWNPFSAPAGLQIVTPPKVPLAPEAIDVLLALGHAAAEGEDAWRLQVLRRGPGLQWQHDTVPDAGFAIDPLPGVIAVTREDKWLEAFVVDDTTGKLAGAQWDVARNTWSVLSLLLDGAKPPKPVTRALRRTNRPAAVSREAGRIDLFYVGDDGLLYVTWSVQPETTVWSAPVALTGNVEAHPLANLVAVSMSSTRADVFFMGRAPGTRDWHLYGVSWTPAGWQIEADTSQLLDPISALEPLASIAACRLDATSLDVFVAGSDGALYNRHFAGGAWSPLVKIRPPPAPLLLRVASVDGACCPAPDRVEVVMTNYDGNVYSAERNGAAAQFKQLENAVSLNLF
jgi:Domain of unknown function (DUF1906)